VVKISISSTLATNAYFQLKNTHGSILVVSWYIYFFAAFDIRVEIYCTYCIGLSLGLGKFVPGDHYGIGNANVGVAQFSL